MYTTMNLMKDTDFVFSTDSDTLIYRNCVLNMAKVAVGYAKYKPK
jgi:hypothetical protein